MGEIPSGVRLPAYSGDSHNLPAETLQEFLVVVKTEKLSVNVDRVFSLGEIVEAHGYMEGNHAAGKLVVVV